MALAQATVPRGCRIGPPGLGSNSTHRRRAQRRNRLAVLLAGECSRATDLGEPGPDSWEAFQADFDAFLGQVLEKTAEQTPAEHLHPVHSTLTEEAARPEPALIAAGGHNPTTWLDVRDLTVMSAVSKKHLAGVSRFFPHEVQARGGARGGALDIEAWYQETITGSGGEPSGAIKEYILKWFWPAADLFTGPGKAPGKKDHKKVFELLKEVFKQGPDHKRGTMSAGFGSVTGETSGVDGSPYTWLYGSMTPGGMFLQVTREFPGGKGVRPLAVAKLGQEEELWSKIDWNLVNKRLDIVYDNPDNTAVPKEEEEEEFCSAPVFLTALDLISLSAVSKYHWYVAESILDALR